MDVWWWYDINTKSMGMRLGLCFPRKRPQYFESKSQSIRAGQCQWLIKIGKAKRRKIKEREWFRMWTSCCTAWEGWWWRGWHCWWRFRRSWSTFLSCLVSPSPTPSTPPASDSPTRTSGSNPTMVFAFTLGSSSSSLIAEVLFLLFS